jgi:hypothetical protein
MELNLLFVLPDRENKKIITLKTDGSYHFPKYTNPVGENIGFDDAQLFNDFFYNLTGIPVFRRYTFNTNNYVVFVFELADDINNTPSNNYHWITYSDFLKEQQNEEIKNIAVNIHRHYNKSVNMPWVNTNGFSPYFRWLHEVCIAKNISIKGKITQIKNTYVSNVFCIPTETGNLYMKIPGKVFITELPFTHEIKKLGMANEPVWIDFNADMNVFLMKDMGGMDLPPQSDLDTLKKVLVRLAQTQKDSIQYLPLDCEHNDYSIKTILANLHDFPQKAYDILQETKYKITCDEKVQLERNINSAIKLLELVNGSPIPDVIQNGDVRPGNIRVIGNDYIFYDWAWGAISHPFLEPSAFLHIIRRTLPTDISAKKILVEIYLNEWLEYGTQEELIKIFMVLDGLKELFWAYTDYIWVENIHSASNEPIEAMSADGWLLEKRNYYFASVLRRFFEKDFNKKKSEPI